MGKTFSSLAFFSPPYCLGGQVNIEQPVHRARAQARSKATALVARAPVQWMLGLCEIKKQPCSLCNSE